MPPEIKTDRQKILAAALSLLEREGEGALTARKIATELGVSTQPIYREFRDMAELKEGAFNEAYEYFAKSINGEALDQSVGYVRFATEHKNLFNFIFRSGQCAYDGLDDMAHKIGDGTGIIQKLGDITGLPQEDVYRLHLYVWMAMHGLAVMAADNEVAFGDGELKTFTVELTRALTRFYKEKQH